RHFSMLVLPPPETPITVRISPGATSRSTPFRISRPGTAYRSSRTEMPTLMRLAIDQRAAAEHPLRQEIVGYVDEHDAEHDRGRRAAADPRGSSLRVEALVAADNGDDGPEDEGLQQPELEVARLHQVVGG